MRTTPILIARKNLTEAYHNRSILYSLLAPSIIIYAASIIKVNNLEIIFGLAFVFGSLDDALFSLARERETGTLAKLLLSPISRWSITGGRILSSLLLNILSTTLVLALGIPLKIINLDIYPVALFYITSSLITLLTVTIGLLCSSICSSFRLDILLTSFLLVIFAILPSFSISPEGSVYTNPFGYGYQVFTNFLPKQTFLSPQEAFIGMSIWIIILYALANITLRTKIA